MILDSYKSKAPLWLHQRQQLKNAFMEAFDHSLCNHTLRMIRQGKKPANAELIGAGMHFDAYRIKTGNPMELVLKIANNEFSAEQRLHQWLNLINLLKNRQDALLMPPLEILDDQQLAYVQPFTNQTLKKLNPEWHPIEKAIDINKLCLDALGSCIADSYQMGCWQGIPFIYDLSDLIRKPKTWD